MAAGAAGGAAAGLIIAANVARTTKGIARALARWPALEARGLRVERVPTSGLATATGKERPVARGEIAGVPVEVRVVTDVVHLAHTEVVARRAGDTDAKVGVFPSPGGILGSIRDWLRQDIEIGDEVFDAAFLVTGKPASAAKELLASAPLREGIAALAGGPLIGFEHGKDAVRVSLNGVECDVDVLGAAIDVVVMAATRG
jgi:hypothetical protein